MFWLLLLATVVVLCAVTGPRRARVRRELRQGMRLRPFTDAQLDEWRRKLDDEYRRDRGGDDE